ncbi:EAL and HDOD domain-containing protein [Rhodoferax sp. PAMC 29310]|uniref:EAL and HDOD domain-containing protein n=1 Tax=Rhodoferax sp. PAMC 29310 TaxID=2822760 RepID=UPI001B318CD0|nr:HDOD domain-containing protein [Rhodoferax sp. PAMC 29310]
MPNLPDPLPWPEAVAPDTTAFARQAILNLNRTIFGFELFDRSLAQGTHTSASDAALLFNVLSHAECEVLMQRKIIFINCTHDTLASGHLELVPPERVVLELPPLDAPQRDDVETHLMALTDIRRRGFRLAFDQSVLTEPHLSWRPLASFIKIDISHASESELSAWVQMARQNPKARLIAEKVETEAQFAMAQDLGFTLFQGYWFAKPILLSGKTVRPAQAAIIQLINLVRQQASTAQIEDVLKRDPTLSFNLLRFINSAGFGLKHEITSFRHAVMMLGLKKLFRWAALLLTTSQGAGTSPAVANLAVVRGRLMELLAADSLTPEECDNAFVVGVFSMLDTLLGMPLAQAIEAIALPDTVVDALLHKQGLLAPYLELTVACENADDAMFAKASATLKLSSQQVNWAHLQALSWTETLVD